MPRKPADVCPGCRKNVKRGCIQCSQCECWFHFSCAGTTEDAANSIDAYHCKLCLNPSVLATVDNISPKQTNPKETDSTAAQPHAPSSSSSPSSLSSSRKRSRPESRVEPEQEKKKKKQEKEKKKKEPKKKQKKKNEMNDDEKLKERQSHVPKDLRCLITSPTQSLGDVLLNTIPPTCPGLRVDGPAIPLLLQTGMGQPTGFVPRQSINEFSVVAFVVSLQSTPTVPAGRPFDPPSAPVAAETGDDRCHGG